MVQDLCREFDLLHCVDPFQAEPVYGQSLYWRLHGKGTYSYRYSDEELAQLAEMVLRYQQERYTRSYVLFNNVWMNQDAIRFQTRMAGTDTVTVA
jgi:uncharacterized protein YecE (DUF72 family)